MNYPNADDAVGDCVMTAFPCRKLNQHCFVFVKQNSVLRRIFWITFAYLNPRQTSADSEDIIPNASNAVGDCHTRQATAAIEGSPVNSGDTVWYRHARQTTAAIEGLPPNAGDAVANRHARQTTAAFEGSPPQWW